MKSIRQISAVLRDQVQRRAVRQIDLKSQAGISARTLTNVLGGQEDFKVSTLLALADRLGLELLLMPVEAATAVAAGPTTAPRVTSRVDAALEQVAAASQGAKTEAAAEPAARRGKRPARPRRSGQSR